MNTKMERFLHFLMQEKTRNLCAFVIYVSCIATFAELKLPIALGFICFIVVMFITLFVCSVSMYEWLDKLYERSNEKPGKNIIKEIRKIAKEILMYIPVQLMSICVTSFGMIGNPQNQTNIEKAFYESPIFILISAVFIVPIIEEFIFRFLPYRFIRNKTIYIIVSTVVFAAMHVINDPNPFYYIWFYMIEPLYWGYRYHKTKDIMVPISMHSFTNLIGIVLFVFS